MSDSFLNGQTLDRLHDLPDNLARCCVTSPPYWGLRDYGVDGQIGLEETPEEYVARLVEVFREVRRVLTDDGTLWLNLGDSYAATGKSGGGDQGRRWERCGADTEGPKGGKWSPAPEGMKPKDLVGIPWMVAFALRADGWYLRSDIIWSKGNPMPESVRDRPTKAHEYVFLLSKSPRYFYDQDAIREPDSGEPAGNGFAGRQGRSRGLPMGGGDGSAERWEPGRGRNRRSVWQINTAPFPEAHFAVMPLQLAQTCVLAGSAVDDVVLDPFGGAGTTALAARLNGRRFVHIDLNPDYIEIAKRRLADEAYQPSLFGGGG